jgi:ATP-dependent DNA helicase RecQ
MVLSNEEFNSISAEIKKISSQKALSTQSLFAQLSSFNQNKIWKVLEFLQKEKAVIVDEGGLIKAS